MSEAFAAIIFDLDGVLIDSEPAHFAAEVEMLQPIGFELTDHIWSQMKGLTDRQFFRRLRQHGLSTELSDEELSRRKLDILRRVLPELARPFPEARATVRSLADRRLALATSSPRPVADIALELLELADAFPVIVSGGDVTHGKPEPEPFLVTASRLGVEPSGCLVIEDSVNGVAAAVAAGMTCMAVEHSFPAAELGKAHLVVPRLAAVPAALATLESTRWHELR